jgi:hypothetical protein
MVEVLKTQGFIFIRELPLNTGWSMLSTGDYPFGGNLAYFSFRVLEGIVQGVSFGLSNQRDKDAHEQQRFMLLF